MRRLNDQKNSRGRRRTDSTTKCTLRCCDCMELFREEKFFESLSLSLSLSLFQTTASGVNNTKKNGVWSLKIFGDRAIFLIFYRTNSVCEDTKTKKTIIKMAANPILMFASLCCGIMGISFFFGFYFGMVEKDIEHNKENRRSHRACA